MKDIRESKPLGTIHMINYMRYYHHAWVEEYSMDKKTLMSHCYVFAGSSPRDMGFLIGDLRIR